MISSDCGKTNNWACKHTPMSCLKVKKLILWGKLGEEIASFASIELRPWLPGVNLSLSGKLSWTSISPRHGWRYLPVETWAFTPDSPPVTFVKSWVVGWFVWILIMANPLFSIVHTDACVEGAGAVFDNDCVYCNWEVDWPICADLHIRNNKTLAIMLACLKWAPRWRNECVIIKTAMGMIIKGISKNDIVIQAVIIMHWLSSVYNFHNMITTYIPGHTDVIADAVSRLKDKRFFTKFVNMLPPIPVVKGPYPG